MLSAYDLKGIASAGGNLTIDGSSYTPYDIKGIAEAGKKTGASLVVKNALKLSAYDCKGIAAANPGHVTFDFGV